MDVDPNVQSNFTFWQYFLSKVFDTQCPIFNKLVNKLTQHGIPKIKNLHSNILLIIVYFNPGLASLTHPLV